MRSLKRITAVAAVTTLALIGIATPASASTVYGCPDGYICVYDGTNYGTWHWGRQSIENVRTWPSSAGTGCAPVDGWVDMGGSGDFNNTVSSIVVNPSGTTGTRVNFWMNANCTGTPIPYSYFSGGLDLDPDLSNGGFGVGSNWSNAVTSISVGTGW